MTDISYLEFVGVGTSDAHKPTYRQLLDEGLSQTAIETLMLSRDALAIMPATEVGDWINLSVRHHPITLAEVYPDGPPCHCEQPGFACLLHADDNPWGRLS